MENLAKGKWTDPERVQEFAKTYSTRYGESFWNSLMKLIPRNRFDGIGDFGCGPGMWLADAVNKFSASKAFGLDASEAMLDYAKELLPQIAPNAEFHLHNIDFDTDPMPLEPLSLDMTFGGYMLHEVADADDFLNKVFSLVRPNGVSVIFDFISGDEEEFVRQMARRNMSEERARKRYPHMCKHSIDDIKEKILRSGYASVRSEKLGGIRGIVVGVKENNPK